MERDLNVYLKDVAHSIEIIEQFIEGIDFDEFSHNLMRQEAVIRRLIVIGEAFSRYKHLLPEKDPDFPYVQAISMKNFLVHEYEKVRLLIVWDTVVRDIPDLKKKIQKIIK